MFLCVLALFCLPACGFISKDSAAGTRRIGAQLERMQPKKKNHKEYREINDNRITALVLGSDGGRTDTIMLATYDADFNRFDVISIPRDTYIETGRPGAEMKKINSVYQMGGFEELSEDIKKVLNTENLEIDRYVMLDYEGAKTIIDALGGVEMDIPAEIAQNTENLVSGVQNLEGNNALEYLRQRKSFDEGDIGRVRSQQEFTGKLLEKVKDNKLKTLKSLYTEVDTNIGMAEALKYGYRFSTIDKNNIRFHILPGHPEYRTVEGQTLSYYVGDNASAGEMMNGILNNNDGDSGKIFTEQN